MQDLDYLILGQLIPAKNNPEIFDEYECKQNEVKLFSPLYDINNSTYLGVDTLLAFIMVRSDLDVTSFLYGYNESKSNLLYSVLKKIMPNILKRTCFKKHVSQISAERSAREFSNIFFLCALHNRQF